MAELERRIRAAQQLGGFASLDDLAAAIGRESDGLSRKTLRRIASDSDSRKAKDYELRWIADACGVPLSFLERGPDGAGEPERLEQIERKLDLLLLNAGLNLPAGRATGHAPDRVPEEPEGTDEAQKRGA